MEFTYENLKGLEWAKEVIEGKFIANKWVKLECKKYIDRIETLQHKEDFKFYFNLKEAKIIYGLLHFINLATGHCANKPFVENMVGYQAFVIENVFCWFRKDDPTGQKMVEEVYLQLGRKSSKSVLSAIIELLILLRAPKFSQHAIAGKTRDISALIKADMERIIKASPKIAKYFKITRERILCKHNEAFCKNLSGEANNLNGLLLSTYIIDECANQETQEIIGALKLSQMSVQGSRLSIYISTAYDLEVNAFRELCDYYKKVLDGVIEDNKTLGLIFELDEGDDYTDENLWIKASPLQMTFEAGREFLRDEFKKALEVPSKMREFRIKILNQYLPSAKVEGFIELEKVRKCSIPTDKFNWYGRRVWLGLDLSQTCDNTSVTMLTYDEMTREIVAKSWAFIPNRVNEKSIKEKVDYYQMIQDGNCFIAGDEEVIDHYFVYEFIMNLEEIYGVTIEAIGYDRYNCLALAGMLTRQGYNCIEIIQHSRFLHQPTKLLEESVLSRKFYYIENPLYEINFANCRVQYDTNLNKYVTKKKSNGKVDMVVSTIIALYLINNEILNELNNFGAIIV